MSKTKYMLRSAIVLAAVFSGVSANAALNGKHDAQAPAAQLERNTDLLARKGADDRPGHTRRGRGRDDGPNHVFLLKLEDMQLARRGADDKPGHVRRGRGSDDATQGHKHRGRGTDDAPGDDRRGRRV